MSRCSIAFSLFAAVFLLGCEKQEPFDINDYPSLQSPPHSTPSNLPPSATVIVEMVGLDTNAFTKWSQDNPGGPERATTLRSDVQRWIHEGAAKLIRTSAIHVKSGKKVSTSSGSEIIYPTSYKASVPRKMVVEGEEKKPDPAFVVQKFQTKKTGEFLELKADINRDANTISIEFSPNWITFQRNANWKSSNKDDPTIFETPVFGNVEIRTSITLLSGSYGLLASVPFPEEIGTIESEEPLLLIFVRADTYLPEPTSP